MVTTKQTHVQAMATEFICRNRAATLSTVTPEGKPHSSVVYCVVHSDLTIYFTTRAEGRKFAALRQNPEVCLLFTGFGTLQQLQLSGIASRVAGREQQLDLLHELMKLRYEEENLPRPTVNLLEAGIRKEYAIFKVVPYEMTYANFATAKQGMYKPEFVKIISYHPPPDPHG